MSWERTASARALYPASFGWTPSSVSISGSGGRATIRDVMTTNGKRGRVRAVGGTLVHDDTVDRIAA